MSVGLRGSGRKHLQGDRPLLAFAFEFGLELGPSVDLDGFDAERHFADELVKEVLGVPCVRPSIGFRVGPFGDGGGRRDELLHGRLRRGSVPYGTEARQTSSFALRQSAVLQRPCARERYEQPSSATAFQNHNTMPTPNRR